MAEDNVQMAVTEIAKFVRQKTEEMNERIEEMRREISQIKTQPKAVADSSKDSKRIAELEERMKRDVERIESVIQSNLSSLVEEDVKKYLDKASDVRSELKNEVGSVRRDLTAQMRYLESKINDVKADLHAMNIGDVEAKLHAFDTRLSDAQASKQRMHDLEEQLAGLKSAISSKVVQASAGDKSLVEAHVRRLDEMERRLADVQKAVSRGTDSVILGKMKSEMMEQISNARAEMNAKLSHVVDETSGRLNADIEKEIEEIKKQLSAQLKRDEDATRKYIAEFEKEESGISDTLKKDEASVQKQMQEIFTKDANTAARFNSLEKHLEALGKRLDGVARGYEEISREPETYTQLFKDVMELKQSFDEESSLRISGDKAMKELEQKVNELNASLVNVRQLEKLDYNKILQAVRTREEINQKTMEQAKAEAATIATRYLDEFAKTLDRKLPNIASKDDIAQMDARLEQIIDRKVRAVKPATVNPMLERRVESMERTVRELMFVLQELNRQKPFVVE